MKTFLFAWNPKKWDWTTLEQSIEEIKKTGKITDKWSVVSHKKIKPGDRVFLMRLGKEPKGIMASGFGFDTDYFDEANDNVVCLVIIETAEAVANIDEIFAVEGVDSYIVGPFDLSISLGIPREFEHPRFKEAVETVLAAAHNAGKPPGTDVDAIPCTAETFDAPIRDGYKMLLVDGDEWMLHAACKNVIECCEQSKDSLKS